VPIKQVHYLVSVPLDKVLDAKSLISELIPPNPIYVSILVLMELCIKTLQGSRNFVFRDIVSILVLMELCIKTEIPITSLNIVSEFQSLF